LVQLYYASILSDYVDLHVFESRNTGFNSGRCGVLNGDDHHLLQKVSTTRKSKQVMKWG